MSARRAKRREGSRAAATRAGVAIAAAASLAVVLLTAGLSAAPAAADDLTPAGESAMAQIAGCAAGATGLLVAVVVDESGSLRETDPTNERVNGVNSIVDALADLRAGTAAKLDVQASLAVFAETYTPLVGWLALDEANAAHLKSVSSQELPARNAGAFTDYRTALTGAQTSLDARDAELGGTNCKVLLWFTDGALDVPGGDTAAAFNELCAPAGIVDRVRAAHVAVIALALFQDQGGVTAEQREQLRAVAEGSGSGVGCGQTPVASDAAVGAYLSAGDASALRRVFAGVGALISGASSSASITCPSPECAGDAVAFAVDRGVTGFQLIADSADAAATLTLTGPGGQPIALTAGAPTLPGGSLAVTGRDGLTTATATLDGPDGESVGAWSLTARDAAGQPSPVAVDVLYFWGAQLTIEAPGGVLIGADSTVIVRATVAGQSVSADWYESLAVELRAGDAPVELAAGDDGAWTGTLALPADAGDGVAQADVTLTASATAVSAPSGIRLSTASASVVLPTRLAPSYPTLAPARLDLPEITTTAGSTGTLTLTGGERDAMSVCLGEVALDGPGAAGALALSADADCVDVAPGETKPWTFTLAPAVMADGAISGHVRIVMTGAADAVSIDVPVSAAITRSVNQPLRWAVFAGLVALAALIPLLLIAAGDRRTRRSALATLAALAPAVSAGGLVGGGPGPGRANPDGAAAALSAVAPTSPGPSIDGAGDEFDGVELAPGWTAVRNPAVEVVGGELRWPIDDGGQAGALKDAGLLLRNAPKGNWTAETRMTLLAGKHAVQNAAQVGLVAYVDSNLITCLSNATAGSSSAGTSKAGTSMAGTGTAATTWLRLTRRTHGGEHRLWASTSSDGDTWREAGMWMLPANIDLRVGLTAHNAADTTATFTYLRFYSDEP